MPSHSPLPRASRQGGFSLIELLIGMVIAIEILVAALTVFDVHNRMARVQIQITDLQQSLRVAQYDMVRTTRMAGRGGLRADFRVDNDDISVPWLRGLGVEVRDNVADGGDNEVALGTEEPVAIPGTDILSVRGCLSGLLFQMDPSNPGDFSLTSLTVRRALPSLRTQALDQLLDDSFDGPLLLQSAVSRGQFAVAEVTAVAGDANVVTFTITFASALSPPNPLVAAPDADFVPGWVCGLEEYRYYVRQTPGDDIVPIKPRLARARMIPGTELPYAEDEANLTLDLADDIFDLQVALGFDTDYDSAGSGVGSFDHDPDFVGADDFFYEGADDAARGTDDWFGNSSADDPADDQYRVNTGIPGRPARLHYVRITTLGRTARPDPKYVAPDFDPVAGVDFIENHDYDDSPVIDFKSLENRAYRHRILKTVVDLRNI